VTSLNDMKMQAEAEMRSIRNEAVAEPMAAFTLFYVYTDDPSSTSPPRVHKVWATDSIHAIVTVERDLQDRNDTWTHEIMGCVETDSRCYR